jgi:hypothetical protein
VAAGYQNQYKTYTETVTGTRVQLIQDFSDADSSCTDPSIYFRFVSIGEVDQVSQNTDGSYEITCTFTQMVATVMKQEWVSFCNSNNIWGYSDWQLGVSKDCFGRVPQPGYSPAPTEGSQQKLLMKVDGDKLTVTNDNYAIRVREFTRQ